MSTYTPEQLSEILDLHTKWLRNDPTGQRAYLTDADLANADLTRAYLTDAYLTRADLTDANLIKTNLAGADLTGADLTRADLAYAILVDANLSDANLANVRSFWGTVGNMAEVKSIQVDTWPVTYTSTHMQIGCQLHPLSDWWAFDNKQIGRMDAKALDWWHTWKPILHTIIAASPATPTEHAE